MVILEARLSTGTFLPNLSTLTLLPLQEVVDSYAPSISRRTLVAHVSDVPTVNFALKLTLTFCCTNLKEYRIRHLDIHIKDLQM